MGFYNRVLLPRLCDLAMRSKRFGPYRERAAKAAQGRVLEIGAGSGLNLDLYPAEVNEIVAVEPDGKLLELAERNAAKAGRRVTFIQGSAEEIPLDDESADTIVTTWTLCTIPNPERALAEMRRVLKPAGHLIFAEHGLAPEHGVRKWQNRLTPAWMKVAGGCHLNRPIDALIRSAGFEIEELNKGYLPGPRIMAYQYEGRARPSRGPEPKQADEEQRRRLEQELDEGLENTFPASDPVAVTEPASTLPGEYGGPQRFVPDYFGLGCG